MGEKQGEGERSEEDPETRRRRGGAPHPQASVFYGTYFFSMSRHIGDIPTSLIPEMGSRYVAQAGLKLLAQVFFLPQPPE
ncbi:hypothetical protein CR201_G0031167 [Pongo abelii]|uniref:Uncharacterized protein n=1 Tax=Pongo abelii TaxID=9601 RepID=A0A2J8U1I1_PONAB|nr:hypothetical protein CR201_G0031167 [Pongo abelii]